MTRRRIRHLWVKVKVAALTPFLLVFGWMSGTLLRDGWRWMFGDRFVAGIVAWCAGLAVSALATLVALEINAAWLRWRKAQELEDKLRCALPECDRPLRRPYASFEKGFVCVECYRRIGLSDLPPIARKVRA